MTNSSDQIKDEQIVSVESAKEVPVKDEAARVIDIIAELKKMLIERKIPLSQQSAFKGTQYRALQLFITIIFALLIIGAMLIKLLGPKHWAVVPLLNGITVAGLVSFGAFALFMLINNIIRWRTEGDPFSEEKLKARLEHEESCVQQLIKLKPTETDLERVSLHLKGQVERYSGYTVARNEYLLSIKDLTLAGLLILGVTAENARGGWAEFILSAQLAGAVALITGTFLGQVSKAKVYRYQFWLSIIDLTRHSMKPEVHSKEEPYKGA